MNEKPGGRGRAFATATSGSREGTQVKRLTVGPFSDDGVARLRRWLARQGGARRPAIVAEARPFLVVTPARFRRCAVARCDADARRADRRLGGGRERDLRARRRQRRAAARVARLRGGLARRVRRRSRRALGTHAVGLPAPVRRQALAAADAARAQARLDCAGLCFPTADGTVRLHPFHLPNPSSLAEESALLDAVLSGSGRTARSGCGRRRGVRRAGGGKSRRGRARR